MTSSHQRTISAACRLSSSPVESSVTLICASRSISQSAHRLECISASPPDRTTHCTWSLRIPSTCSANSSRDSSVPLRFAFQMSHMTQRQLQRLCGMSTSTGIVCRRCEVRVSCRRAISSGEIMKLPYWGRIFTTETRRARRTAVLPQRTQRTQRTTRVFWRQASPRPSTTLTRKPLCYQPFCVKPSAPLRLCASALCRSFYVRTFQRFNVSTFQRSNGFAMTPQQREQAGSAPPACFRVWRKVRKRALFHNSTSGASCTLPMGTL